MSTQALYHAKRRRPITLASLSRGVYLRVDICVERSALAGCCCRKAYFLVDATHRSNSPPLRFVLQEPADRLPPSPPLSCELASTLGQLAPLAEIPIWLIRGGNHRGDARPRRSSVGSAWGVPLCLCGSAPTGLARAAHLSLPREFIVNTTTNNLILIEGSARGAPFRFPRSKPLI